MIIKRIIFILFLSAAMMQGSLGQVINTMVGSQTVCPGTLEVPVVVTNCNGVSAISLALSFNSQVLTYQTYQNLHPALNNGLLIINQASSKVFISWANTNPANIGNDTLVKLVFNTVPGTSGLNWDTQTPGNCEYSNVSGLALPATFVNGTISVNAPPEIISSPSDVSLITGQGASFHVDATGTALFYEWQISIDTGLVWNNIISGMGYTGFNSATLNIASVTLLQNGYQYRCKVSGTCPVPVFSEAALLTVNPPPQEISIACGTIDECPGNYVVPIYVTNFTDVGSFSLALNYNSALLNFTGSQNLNDSLSQGLVAINATADKVYLTWAAQSPVSISSGQAILIDLLFSSVSSGTGTLTWDTQTPGNCEFSDSIGSQIISVFSGGNVTIDFPPAIATQPVNSTVDEGQTAYFSISASGTQIFYQWQVSTDNGLNWTMLTNTGGYTGVTTANMHIANVPNSLNGNLYRCEVQGYCSPATVSDPVLLTVIPTPQVIGVTCGSYTGCAGQLIIPVTVSNFDSVGSFSLALDFTNTLISYVGIQNQQPALNQGMLVANATGNQVFVSWASQTAGSIATGSGILFELVFSGNLGGTGTFSWDISTAGNCEFSTAGGTIIQSVYTNGSLNLLQPPLIAVHPLNSTKEAGQTATFSVSATGAGLWYQWQQSSDFGVSWTNTGSNSSTLTLGGVSLGMIGNRYRCIINGTCEPADTSDYAVLTVVPATQVISVTLPTIANQCVQNMSVPLAVSNFTGVGAFSFAIEFDPALLTFVGVSGLSSELSSGLLISNAINGTLYLSWASTVTANINSGVLLNLDFLSYGGTTALIFDVQTPGNCEIADGSGDPISTLYTNGSIAVAAQPLAVSAGPDLVMVPGTPVTLNASISGGNPPYQKAWSPSLSLSDTTVLQPIANPAVSTLYTLEVTDNSGCTGTDEMWVLVETIPATGWLWASGNGGSAEDEALCITTDPSGNAIASGYFASTTLLFGTDTLINTGNNSLFVTKYDPNGQVLWAKQSENDGWTEGKAIASDASGNIYVAGSFQSSNLEIEGQLAVGNGWADAFVAKFGASGNLVWVQSFGGSSLDKATGIGVDANGDIIVSGFFLSSTISAGNNTLTNTAINFADVFLLKLDPSGNVIWAKKAGGNEWDEPSQIVVSPAGEIYMTGYFVSPVLQFSGATLNHLGTGTPNSFLAKYNSNGSILWAKRPALSQENYGTSVVVDSLNNVLWGGYFNDTQIQLGDSVFANSGGSDIYFSRLTSSGTYLWSNHPQGTGYEQPTAIVCRNSNETVLLGNYNSSVLTFGNQQITGAGFYDFFLTHYDSLGNVLVASHIGNSGEDIANGAADDGLGNIFVAGSYKSQSLMFDSWQAINANAGVSDLFVAKYGATNPVLSIGANISPPVCSGDVNGTIQAIVIQGMPPFTYLWSTGATGQSITGLAAGTYSVTVTDANTNIDSLLLILTDPPMLYANGTVSDASCSNCPNGEIQVTVTGGVSPYFYAWSNGDTVEDLIGVEPGAYSITITDMNGCSLLLSFSVGSGMQTQDINLPLGWSIMSTYMEPVYPLLDSVFAPVVSITSIVKNGIGGVYWPLFNVNSIGNIILGEGYQVKMNTAATLTVIGTAVIPELTPVNIPLGWSIIGYLRQVPGNVVSMMSPIVSNISIMKNGIGLVYWPAFNVNAIGNMVPGQGYQIKLTVASVLTYPANTMSNSKNSAVSGQSVNFGKPINSGNNMTLGIQFPNQISGEIAGYSKSGLLVGSAVVDGNFVALTLWGDDELTPEIDGLAKCESISIQIYNEETGFSNLTGLEWMEGDASYEINKIAVARINQTDLENNQSIELYQNVPNPFTDETEISFYLHKDCVVQFAVFNLLGKQIVKNSHALSLTDMSQQSLILPKGKHSILFKGKGLPAGTYYYKLQTEDYSIARKMVIMK
jgi:hypothetical protein